MHEWLTAPRGAISGGGRPETPLVKNFEKSFANWIFFLPFLQIKSFVAASYAVQNFEWDLFFCYPRLGVGPFELTFSPKQREFNSCHFFKA